MTNYSLQITSRDDMQVVLVSTLCPQKKTKPDNF